MSLMGLGPLSLFSHVHIPPLSLSQEYGQAMETYSGEERQEKALPGSSKL